jgi:hypothetical protein
MVNGWANLNYVSISFQPIRSKNEGKRQNRGSDFYGFPILLGNNMMIIRDNNSRITID